MPFSLSLWLMECVSVCLCESGRRCCAALVSVCVICHAHNALCAFVACVACQVITGVPDREREKASAIRTIDILASPGW